MTTTWHDQGNCRGVNPKLFYPERGDSQGVAHAKAVCAQCDVRDECLNHAIDTLETFGIWGGKTAQERQWLRRGRPRVAVIDHGTERGYHAHRRALESPCAECRRAHAEERVVA